MGYRKVAFVVLFLAVAQLATGNALAGQSWRGEGELLAVDLASNTVTVEEGTFALNAATKIRNPRGILLDRVLIEDRVGDPVSFLVRNELPRPVLRVLVLEDPEPAH